MRRPFPGTITLPSGVSFTANAVPDLFDERDLLYLPRLERCACG
jgi:hypothetical protein